MFKSKKAITVFAALGFLLANLVWAGGDSEKDIFAGLNRGERVTVFLKNNISYTGIIKSIISDKIEMDISYDDPVLKGSFSFRRRDIKNIQARVNISRSERERIEARKEQIKPDKNPNSKPEFEPAAPEAQPEKKELNEDEIIDLLNKFQPGELWSDKGYQDILDKNVFIRTDEENEFLENYQDWLKAIEMKKRQGDMDFFAKFLPEDGWGEEKHIELITRYIRLKIGLTAEEQEFVDKYEFWKKIRALYEEEQKNLQEIKPDEPETLTPPVLGENTPVEENSGDEEQPETPRE